jgi:hypothetical protein
VPAPKVVLALELVPAPEPVPDLVMILELMKKPELASI